MAIHEILAEYRLKNMLTQQQVAAYLTGLGRQTTIRTVSNWENGRALPDVERFLFMCEHYGIADIYGTFLSPRARSDGEGLSPFSRLNAKGRQRAQEYIALLSKSDDFLMNPEMEAPRLLRRVPLYAMPVSAGTGSFLDSDDCELIEVDESVPIGATYAVRISGDSMEPRFVDKQIVYVEPQPNLRDGEIGIFLLNGEAFCKRMQGDRLLSLNKKYPPIAVREHDDFRIYGKVLA